jgi:AcrR family transcriptional regulator
MCPKVREPKQDRSIKTKNKLLEAGKRVFSQRNYHDVHAGDIARDAGVAVGSFYAYFHDKRDLFIALLDEYLERNINVLREGARNFSFRESVHLDEFIYGALETLLKAHMESPSLLREFLRMALYDDELKDRMNSMDMLAREILKNALMQLSRIKKREVKSIAYMLYYASEGVIHQMVLNPGEMNEKTILRNFSGVLSRYLESESL